MILKLMFKKRNETEVVGKMGDSKEWKREQAGGKLQEIKRYRESMSGKRSDCKGETLRMQQKKRGCEP